MPRRSHPLDAVRLNNGTLAAQIHWDVREAILRGRDRLKLLRGRA